MTDLDMIDPKTHRQLLIDDGAIETREGVSRVLEKPTKCGPMIRGGVQSRATPLWNPEKSLWEWWYMGSHTNYATSPDGENWELPSLGLYEFEGSRDNNIAC
ncbi:MAG: hypothetical protein VX255_00705, partial [Candidatus Latescibacterota bacterium]|nr:hypothetical protein [Candidatus Latescibacterota bacterium]